VSSGVAAVLLEPFALWQHKKGYGDGEKTRCELALEPPAPLGVVAVGGGRVLALDRAAFELGVRVGMKTLAVQGIAPGLTALEQDTPELRGRWAETLESLYLYGDRLEAAGMGRAFLKVSEARAREIALSYPAQVGLAASKEVALLAALTAPLGSVHAVSARDETRWLRGLPIGVLGKLGLEPRALEKLTFLGLGSLGQLMDWKVSQRRAYFGKGFKTFEPFLNGPHSDRVGLYQPQILLEAKFDFWDTVHEPHQIEPVLHKLCIQLERDLGERRAIRLGVRATVGGVALEAWRSGKQPLREADALLRLARLTLLDTRACELGLESLTLTLSGVARHFSQGALFERKPGREAALESLEERYPDALLGVRWLQPKAHAVDHAYEWVVLSSGIQVEVKKVGKGGARENPAGKDQGLAKSRGRTQKAVPTGEQGELLSAKDSR